ncbi:MAG: type II toxin-antitoxin system RelE/ParE family toxin [Opitutaceae bacterium]
MHLTFVETPIFTRQVTDFLDDDAYRNFQNDLLADPERGDLMVGCRGLRKARMALPGRGKSGGARVIYLHLKQHSTIYLFYLFRKFDAANLTRTERNELAALCDQIKAAYAKKRSS